MKRNHKIVPVGLGSMVERRDLSSLEDHSSREITKWR